MKILLYQTEWQADAWSISHPTGLQSLICIVSESKWMYSNARGPDEVMTTHTSIPLVQSGKQQVLMGKVIHCSIILFPHNYSSKGDAPANPSHRVLARI